MNERVKVFFINLIFWGVVVFIIGGIIFYQFQNRQVTHALVENGVVTLGRVTLFKGSSGDDPARVRYAYYYNGQPYKVERDAYRSYEKGGYVYVILNPKTPEKGYHISMRKVNEADTVLNLMHDHLNLTKSEIARIVPGSMHVFESVQY